MTKLRNLARGARRAMMGISWVELVVIVLVALIVIGPKDLPTTLRTLGRSLRAIRRMAGEFQSQVDQFIRDSEIETMRREVEDAFRDAGKASPKAPAKPGPSQVIPPKPLRMRFVRI